MLKIVLYHYQNARIRRSVFAGLSLSRESNAGVHVQERVSQDRHGCLKARHLATNPETAHKHVIVFLLLSIQQRLVSRLSPQCYLVIHTGLL